VLVWTLTPFAVLLVGAAAAAALRFPFSPERRGGRCSAASPPTPALAAPRVALMNAGAEDEEEEEEQEGETF
jgi:hypothetical protein